MPTAPASTVTATNTGSKASAPTPAAAAAAPNMPACTASTMQARIREPTAWWAWRSSTTPALRDSAAPASGSTAARARAPEPTATRVRATASTPIRAPVPHSKRSAPESVASRIWAGPRAKPASSTATPAARPSASRQKLPAPITSARTTRAGKPSSFRRAPRTRAGPHTGMAPTCRSAATFTLPAKSTPIASATSPESPGIAATIRCSGKGVRPAPPCRPTLRSKA